MRELVELTDEELDRVSGGNSGVGDLIEDLLDALGEFLSHLFHHDDTV